MSRIRNTTVLLVAAVAGCEAAPGVELTVVRDSAGVHIVESVAPQWGVGEGWTIGPAPLLDLAISGSGPNHEFVTVRDVRRLGDGRIIVVDEGTDEIRAYSSEGSFLTSVGRNGEGPGEFERPMSVEPFTADSLVVWDFWLRRITVFDGDLKLGRVATLSASPLRPGVRLFWFGDSTFVGSQTTGEGFGDLPGYYRQPINVTRFSFHEERYDTIATLAGYEGFSFDRGDARPPFGKLSQLAVRNGQVIGGDADRMEFAVYDPDGAVRQIFGVPSYDLSISPAERKRDLETLMPPEAPPFLHALVRDMPVPDTRPAYVAIRVDSEGYLWAAHYQSYGDRDEAQLWEVFSPDGRWMGAVTTPSHFDVLTIGLDHVAGIHKDEFDVQHPQILRLDRRGGQ